MFAYCRNSPPNRVDVCGSRDSSIWSFKNDEIGRELLFWYLYGNGKDFPTTKKHSDYLKSNDLLKNQVQNYLFEIADSLSCGESVSVDVSISVVIENGEDIIGYQYLHGTDMNAGGFQMQGTITKAENGDCIFDITYTWNDLMNPNPIYSSDMKKARLAEIIANPKDYYIAISWRDVSIRPGDGNPFDRFGWLAS